MLLATQELTKSFGGMKAVDSLSLEFKEGELRCIIGPNGSGKTTLFNLLTGEFRPTSGTVKFDGRDITNQSIHKISKLGICRKFQNPNIFDELSVQDNLRVSIISDQKIRKLFKKNDESEINFEIDRILSIVDLSDKREYLAESLSHGEKQWLEIGMVLIKKPRIVLLDEPTAGMTSSETHKTSALIKNIGSLTTVIVIEHDLDFIRSLNGRITVLNLGKFLAEGLYDEIAANQTVRDVYLGDEA